MMYSEIRDRSLSVFPAAHEIPSPSSEIKRRKEIENAMPTWLVDRDYVAFVRAVRERRESVRLMVRRMLAYSRRAR